MIKYLAMECTRNAISFCQKVDDNDDQDHIVEILYEDHDPIQAEIIHERSDANVENEEIKAIMNEMKVLKHRNNHQHLED